MLSGQKIEKGKRMAGVAYAYPPFNDRLPFAFRVTRRVAVRISLL